MKGGAVVEHIVEAFHERGFVFFGKSSDGWVKLRGQLTPPDSGIGFPCEVWISPTFVDLPRIRLLELPPELPAIVPHLSTDGELCYLAKGSVVLDIYDPVGQSLACLKRAETVFGQILNGGLVEDLQEEFFAYWDGEPCFVDLQGKNLGRQTGIVAKAGGNFLCFITDNEERTREKLKSLNLEVTNERISTFRVKTDAKPRPMLGCWPPSTVADVLAWQSALDIKCRRKIQARIKEEERKKTGGVLIIIESPLMTYGFAVLYNPRNSDANAKRADRRNLIYGLKILPMPVIRIDDRYLAQRNMPNLKTLARKNIAVVGCGTIGGYLSDMLIKAGAGTSGGKLVLVDFDHLQPQNIGRHRLGFPDLLSNKASAMAKELRRLAPGAEIRDLPVDVRQANLGNLDLLIDATGEESLGHWLCGKYGAHFPMLTVWIEGAGAAVRALLSVEESGACYRCLWHCNKRGELKSTVAPLPQVLAGYGCEGLYVPFPAFVSVQAASLGAEMALDWANDVCSPTLRTRITDRNHQLATPDCDPAQDQECPICNL